MWPTSLRVVKPARVPDPGSPKLGKITLDPDQGATVLPGVWRVEFQTILLQEETEGGTREFARTGWRIITERGVNIPDLEHTDGVLVDGITGVLSVVGEVGRIVHSRIGHDEFTVERWVG